LRREAAQLGIGAERLIFADRLPSSAEHLARHRLGDLFLDTHPYGAHSTALDALWAGLPVLTRLGESFASRVAASFLNTLELPELITATPKEYEDLAVELAANPEKLAIIRLKLDRNRFTAPLFDTPRFARNLESVYVAVHERYRAGLQADHISVAAQPR
jgi:predicted O-linked N-acetylglucosamine transferase (SPINDLY family)